ncbi:MAG: ATP/GTP-binding protein [Nitrosomonadales bacterium]|nr:ATP/GTP-binding protein [Nitrosomonadales bacterium]
MEHKIIFAGPTGAGKTTAIGQVSERPPVSTDVINSDARYNKATTTVAIDFGEITLDAGEKLRLYGVPGQHRFSFVWDIAARGALGVILIADNSLPEPMKELQFYLDGFASFVKSGAAVVVVNRLETHPSPSQEDYVNMLIARGTPLPVCACDPRKKEDVLTVLDVLLTVC